MGPIQHLILPFRCQNAAINAMQPDNLSILGPNLRFSAIIDTFFPCIPYVIKR